MFICTFIVVISCFYVPSLIDFWFSLIQNVLNYDLLSYISFFNFWVIWFSLAILYFRKFKLNKILDCSTRVFYVKSLLWLLLTKLKWYLLRKKTQKEIGQRSDYLILQTRHTYCIKICRSRFKAMKQNLYIAKAG